MKYLRLLNILPMGFFILMLLALPAMAYTIDGKLDDWGVNLQTSLKEDGTGDLSGSNWLPSNSIDYVVADKIDPIESNEGIDTFYNPYKNNQYYDWTGYKSTGVHIIGTGKSHNIYKDFKLQYPDSWAQSHNNYYLPPAGGGDYDLKAIYFDDYYQNIYIAIVTAIPPSGITPYGTYHMGDISLTLNGVNYGIQIPTSTDLDSTDKDLKCMIKEKPLWTGETADFKKSEPLSFDKTIDSKIKGYATIKYLNSGFDDTGVYTDYHTKSFPTYVIEAQIPKSAVGNPSIDTIADMHLTIGCGNDVLELNGAHVKTNIPEFPSVVVPIAAIMGIILIYGRRKD